MHTCNCTKNLSAALTAPALVKILYNLHNLVMLKMTSCHARHAASINNQFNEHKSISYSLVSHLAHAWSSYKNLVNTIWFHETIPCFLVYKFSFLVNLCLCCDDATCCVGHIPIVFSRINKQSEFEFELVYVLISFSLNSLTTVTCVRPSR